MIFDGHLELKERSDLRMSGFERKQKILGKAFKGAGAIEMETFECLEHLMQKDPELPFVEIIEFNDNSYEKAEESMGEILGFSEVEPPRRNKPTPREGCK